MSQSKKMSIVEAVANNAIAFGISLAAQMVIYPLMGIPVTFKQNIVLILIFTAISIVRNYYVRRMFNRIHERFHAH
jgi:membrane protein implicated in regulation of membrane protease activity